MRRRQHKRIKHQSHSLSVDINGPHQMAGDLSRFILVFAYKGEPERVIVEGEQLGEGVGESNEHGEGSQAAMRQWLK